MYPTRAGNDCCSESGSKADIQSDSASHEVFQKRSTPENSIRRSPIRKKKIGLTQGQKRALIENLQLESKLQCYLKLQKYINWVMYQLQKELDDYERNMFYRHKDFVRALRFESIAYL